MERVVTEYLGSLLSLYALTTDGLYLVRAFELANFLVPHYKHALSLPLSFESKYFARQQIHYRWLENRYLADLLEEPKYWDRTRSKESIEYTAKYPVLHNAGMLCRGYLKSHWSFVNENQ